MVSPKSFSLGVVALGVSMLLGQSAIGQALLDANPASTCTTDNCDALEVRGHYSAITTGASTGGQGPVPWVQKYAVGANECVRIQVLNQSEDLEMVVIAPGGTIYRNDDKGSSPCPLCSLVKIASTNPGYYVVQLSQFAGTPVVGTLRVSFGRYNPGNPNCASPTTPNVAPAAAKAKFIGVAANGSR